MPAILLNTDFKHSYSKRAFTLIELSIVLVIIGLIVGGVLVGRDLIHAAEIRKTIKEKEGFDAAVNTFRLKYNALPGDITNAHQFFGTACGDTTTSGETGCNGNGNGKIEETTNAFFLAEEYKLWMHLSLAGLINGTYTGRVADIMDPIAIAGENVPISSLKTMSWFAVASGNAMSPWSSTSRNAYCLGEANNTNYCVPTMLVDDAYAIDSKIDDGLPESGKVFGDGAGDCYGASYFANMSPGQEGCTLSFFW